MKRVLERKQQHVLEKEAHELSLHEKKKQLAHSDRPTLSYVNYLKKLKDKVDNLPIDMMRMDDENRQAMQELKNRINREYEIALETHQSKLAQQSWTEFFGDKAQRSFDTLMGLAPSAENLSKELGKQITLINQFKESIFPSLYRKRR